jgi:lysophospholipase L1-like esterase
MPKKTILLVISIGVVISISLVLIVCELGVRYQFSAWPFDNALYVPDYLTARDAPLRWRFSATDGRNSLGLRNREVGPKKPGVLRILFLGDSLIWSGETSSGELYTEVLERRLNSYYSNGPKTVETINAGIPGYTTYQELEFLKIYGMDMKPDLVILGFVFNDLYYKYLHRPTRQRLIESEPATYLYHFDPSGFPGMLFTRSYFAHNVVDRVELLWKKLRRRPIFRFEQRRDFYLAWKSYGWPQTRKLIGEMQALLKGQGIPLTVMVFPVSDQVDDKWRKLDEAYVLYPQRKIAEICDEYRIPRIDFTGPLYQNGGPVLFRDFLHLNGKGNDIVTEELSKYLVNQLGTIAGHEKQQ